MNPARGNSSLASFDPGVIVAWLLLVQQSSWKIDSQQGVAFLADLYCWSEIDSAADFLGAKYYYRFSIAMGAGF